MKIVNKYKISIIFSLLGWLCLVAYIYIGARIDENGVLIEPFGLIPLFWLLELLALTSLTFTVVKHIKTG
ncbi:DUF3955 domain-containing protein [Vibrio sp. FJH11]